MLRANDFDNRPHDGRPVMPRLLVCGRRPQRAASGSSRCGRTTPTPAGSTPSTRGSATTPAGSSRSTAWRLIGFWTPRRQGRQGRQLVYILAFPSREAAKASWDAFRDDPEWKKAQADSEKDGKIVKQVESVYLDPTDYSAIK